MSRLASRLLNSVEGIEEDSDSDEQNFEIKEIKRKL
jgi:hypothetical protein